MFLKQPLIQEGWFERISEMINGQQYIYTYRVVWSEEDQEYIGLCAEFPSLSYLDKNRHAAMDGIVKLVRKVTAEMISKGEPIPQVRVS